MNRTTLALVAFVGAALLLRHVVEFWLVLPGHDFVGDVRYAEMLADSLRSGRVFPDWIAAEALGRPSTVQRGSVLLFLPPAALVLAGVDAVVASKLWVSLLHVGSLVTFFALARSFDLGRAPALVGALGYGLSRLHLESFVVSGHWQLAVSFFLAPLILLTARRLASAPSGRHVALFALVLASSVLADNERTLTLLPVLMVWLAGEWTAMPSAAARRTTAWALGAAAALTFGIVAAGALPLLLEREWLALARFEELFASHRKVTFSHPAFVFGGGDLLYGPGDARPAGSGGVRASFLLLVGGGAAAIWALSTRRPMVHRRMALTLGVGMVVALWLGTGRPSWAISSFSLYPDDRARSVGVGAILTAAALGILALAARHLSWRGRALLGLAAGVVAFVPASSVLDRLPIVSAVTNLRWFLQVNLPLLGALLLAIAVGELLASRASPSVRGSLAGSLAVLFALDLVATPRKATALDPYVESGARAAFAAMDRDAPSGRYLHHPYVESDARESFAQRMTDRPSASSWLMWSGSRWGVERTARMWEALGALEGALGHPSLQREAATKTLDDLAEADVRYLLLPGSHSGLDAWISEGLVVELQSSSGMRVLRNTRHQTDQAVIVDGSPVPYERPAAERFVLHSAPPGRLVAAEAFYPRWRATIDGRPSTPYAHEGLLALDVPAGAARVELRFERPAYERLLVFGSLGSLALALWLAARRPRTVGRIDEP